MFGLEESSLIALFVMTIGGLCGGVYGMWQGLVQWQHRRKDQNSDRRKENIERGIQDQLTILSERINKIGVDKMQGLEGRVSKLEATQIGYREMKELLDDALATHLRPLKESEDENNKRIHYIERQLERQSMKEELLKQGLLKDA